MGLYNVKLYEYADSFQFRMYEKPVEYSERLQKFSERSENQTENKKDDTERTQEQKDRSDFSSRSRTVNQIYEIARANKWEYFLTITFDRKKIDSSDYDLLCSKVSKWINNIRSRYAPDLKYLLVPELHKDGVHYHFHGLLANIGSMKLTDSTVKIRGQQIYNLENWKYGFSTVSKIKDSGRASSYLVKYITKELCAVSMGKKRYWCSRNLDRPVITVYNLPYEEIERILFDNLQSIRHTSESVISSCGMSVTYIEMIKGETWKKEKLSKNDCKN